MGLNLKDWSRFRSSQLVALLFSFWDVLSLIIGIVPDILTLYCFGFGIASFFRPLANRAFILLWSFWTSNWWPIFVVIFYVLSPIPVLFSRRCITDSYMSDPYNGRCVEFSAFLTSIIVISAYALPVLMAHTPLDAPLIKWSSAAFIFAGNTIIFTTIYIFVRLAMSEESYGGW